MPGPLSKLLTTTAARLDRRYGWDKLPKPLGVITLVGLRNRLREENLYDTGAGGARPATNGCDRHVRAADGSYKITGIPQMKAVQEV